ncbi:flavonol synthase/flavanone 3-hydroxylase-like [Gastrolobium bilobum]|uniref:flavonol synthase/flavanone 3-hydroxylase-like n=1 Tax=Gastrolobium bilobum TaxID=150636 RepID=UPI002AB1BC15|nr:flavonol synthase/flavanone 3-hydroxylase-like [Gastrolobium bilobum]
MVEPCIPTIDLTPFLKEDEDGKKKAMDIITQACSEYGFFQIVNHGVSIDLMKRSIELSKTFFDYPHEEKSKSSPSSNAPPLPAGYNREPMHLAERKEYLVVCPPASCLNVYPENPPEFKEVLEEMFAQLSKTGVLVENIINECLGLPHNFLNEFNHDRSGDVLVVFRYFPASKNENIGITEHEDSTCISFVFQDEVGGLQVLKNGEWIPIVPVEGTIVVNVGDCIQVLSNKKFKSATHRVVRTGGRSRYSYGFFRNVTGDKWVEPLPQFTKEIGEPPNYKGFLYKEYQQLRIMNVTHPPSRPEDVINLTHFAIDT